MGRLKETAFRASGQESAGLAVLPLFPMSRADQHSDLLFDFGPKGLAGEGAPLDPDGVAALAPGDVELELSAGGQPSYWWLLSAE